MDSSKDVGGHKSLTNSKRGSPAKTASSARPGHAQPVPAAVSSFRKESNNTTRNTVISLAFLLYKLDQYFRRNGRLSIILNPARCGILFKLLSHLIYI